MSEISAIYIIQYIKDNFNYIKNKHIQLFNYFKNKISQLTNCNFRLFPSFNDNDKIIISCFSILFNEYNDDIRIRLINNKIFSRKYYHPLKNTINSETIYKNILCIACTIDMEFEDLDNIIEIIQNS